MLKKNELLTSNQISYQLRTSKRFIEEALKQLCDQGRVNKAQLVKNSTLFYLPLSEQIKL